MLGVLDFMLFLGGALVRDLRRRSGRTTLGSSAPLSGGRSRGWRAQRCLVVRAILGAWVGLLVRHCGKELVGDLEVACIAVCSSETAGGLVSCGGEMRRIEAS